MTPLGGPENTKWGHLGEGHKGLSFPFVIFFCALFNVCSKKSLDICFLPFLRNGGSETPIVL